MHARPLNLRFGVNNSFKFLLLAFMICYFLGNEFPAIVEYAPFQRLPKKRRKKDPKSGTMETDSTYLEFLESLKETDSDSREPKMEYSYQPTEGLSKLHLLSVSNLVAILVCTIRYTFCYKFQMYLF